MVKFIETQPASLDKCFREELWMILLAQFNTFRILFSLSSVFHFQCCGYPHIIIITTKIWVWGYSLGDTQITGVTQRLIWSELFLTRDDWDDSSPGDELGGLPLNVTNQCDYRKSIGSFNQGKKPNQPVAEC